MPHIGSEIVDKRGVQLIHDWIQQLPPQFDVAAQITRLNELDEEQAETRRATESTSRRAELAQAAANQRQAAEFKLAGKGAPAEPAPISEVDRTVAVKLDETQTAEFREQRTRDRVAAIEALFASVNHAFVLSRAIQKEQLRPSIRDQVIEAAMARPEPQVRDLFEQFLPPNRRVKRLGAAIRPDQLLAIKGDAIRGRQLFTDTAGVACKNCHRIGDIGGKLGPELTFIARKNSRAQILDSILEPSKVIAPEYISYVLRTNEGQIHTGILTDRKPTEIQLKNAKDEVIRIPTDAVDEIVPQRQSMMPELLLKDLTAENVADLLEYLATQK